MTDHTIIFTPSGIRTQAKSGQTLFEAGLEAGVDIQSICGGKGLCKRCQVEVDTGRHAKFQLDVTADNIGKLTPTEKKAMHDGELAKTRRLACRAKVLGDLVVEIPSDSREVETTISKKSSKIDVPLNPGTKLYMLRLPVPNLADNPCDTESLLRELNKLDVTPTKISARIPAKLQPLLKAHERELIALVRDNDEVVDIWPPSSKTIYGAAIDVGSTSVAIYVYDLLSGQLLYESAAMNPQIRYGEDLMSRVSYVMMNKGGEKKLTDDIQGQLGKMLAAAAKALSADLEQFVEVTLVGNPVMHHLLLGISPVELGQAPFALAVRGWQDRSGRDMPLVGLADYARLSTLPLIGGHVGADTSAAYLTVMDEMKGKSVLLVDIGTNAEIVLSHKGRVAAASSPTGPAFEGAEISAGVRAGPGAIERVRIDPKTFEPRFKIIGHDQWLSDDADLSGHNITGICGSAIFEVMVELASSGLIDDGGLYIPEAAPHRFEKSGKGWKYRLVGRDEKPIYIEQTDIRSVQLAKAALYAGAQLLAESLDCTCFDQVLLAGAFGTHLDEKYVADIAIVPFAARGQIRSIGNAAGMGAAMTLLDTDQKTRIIEAVKNIEKMETALEPKFQDYFVGAMKFPTAPARQHSANDKSGKSGRRRRRQR